MKEFSEKWHNDKKFRAKIKLLLYGIFIIAVTLYAASINRLSPINNEIDDTKADNITTIPVPEKYHYTIDIDIDDKIYNYFGDKLSDKKTITKIKDNITINYTYQNSEYYREDNNIYILTTEDEVYDIIDYNYLNIDNINNYLRKAVINNNQYIVYLKDIILNNNSNDYIIIEINDKIINIDYTQLLKQIDSSIEKCNVKITIENIE